MTPTPLALAWGVCTGMFCPVPNPSRCFWSFSLPCQYLLSLQLQFLLKMQVSQDGGRDA